MPAAKDDPNGRAFELAQQESFGLHIWLAQRSFHGFESAFLQLGVTTVMSRLASYITKPFFPHRIASIASGAPHRLELSGKI